MRPRHYWDSESNSSTSSDEVQLEEAAATNLEAALAELDELEEEELSRRLYDNNGCIIDICSSAAVSKRMSINRPRPAPCLIRGFDQATKVSRELSRQLLLIAQQFVPLIGAVLGISLFHCYLFRPLHLVDIASHWAAVTGVTGSGFKAGLCAATLLTCWATLVLGFAGQAAAARGLYEAEFDAAAWNMRLQLEQYPSISAGVMRNLQPKKFAYFIGAKWAAASVRMKKFTIALVAVFCLVHHCTIIIEKLEMRQDVLHCIFSLALVAMLLCLFSTDILAIQWGCIAASCMLYYLFHLAFYKLQHSSFERTLPRLLAFRDAIDYVPQLDLDMLGWKSGNTGCGPDFISFIVTVIVDGVCIGCLHEINAISAIIKLFSVFGANFIGLTGVEALAMLGCEFMSAPCVFILLFPYLRRLSESEAVFVFAVTLNCATASTDRRFIYFGTDREKFLMQAIVLRHMCVLSCVPICKVLSPVRTKLFTSGTGLQHPGGRVTGSICQRMWSGALDGLRLATLVSKVALIARLCTIMLCSVLNALLHYLSCISGVLLTFRELLGYLLRPIFFLFSESNESLAFQCQLLAEKITFKSAHIHENIMEQVSSYQVKLTFGNLSRWNLQENWKSNLLIARQLYEPVRNGLIEEASPYFAAYMVEDSGSLVEHVIFIHIFFFHCLTGSRVSPTVIVKMSAAALVALVINTRLLWLLSQAK